MKKSKIRRRLFSFLSSLSLIGLAITLAPEDGTTQGMSPEIRDNIHTLFDQHSKVIRKVTLTENGYVALTESKDPPKPPSKSRRITPRSSLVSPRTDGQNMTSVIREPPASKLILKASEHR